MPEGRGFNRDTVTVILAQQGDREAFHKLIELYDRRLLYFILRILGDHNGSLDVLQNVWLTVHKKLKKLKSPASFRVWLYRIAHDLAVTDLRRKSKRPLLVEDIETEEMPNDENKSELVFDNAEMVHVALCKLSVDHRRVLTLHFLENMTIDEIAEVINCKKGTVKSRIYYAKNSLRQQIEEMLNE